MARSVDSVRPAVAPPHTEYLYTGTLALRVHVVHVVMPGRPRQTSIYSRVYRYVYSAHLPVDVVCEPRVGISKPDRKSKLTIDLR